jgi:hypothetical protein
LVAPADRAVELQQNRKLPSAAAVGHIRVDIPENPRRAPLMMVAGTDRPGVLDRFGLLMLRAKIEDSRRQPRRILTFWPRPSAGRRTRRQTRLRRRSPVLHPRADARISEHDRVPRTHSHSRFAGGKGHHHAGDIIRRVNINIEHQNTPDDPR